MGRRASCWRFYFPFFVVLRSYLILLLCQSLRSTTYRTCLETVITRSLPLLLTSQAHVHLAGPFLYFIDTQAASPYAQPSLPIGLFLSWRGLFALFHLAEKGPRVVDMRMRNSSLGEPYDRFVL